MKDVNVRFTDLQLAIYGSEPFSRILYEEFPPRRNATILEAGCGSGKLSINYAIQGCISILLDIDEKVLNYAYDLIKATDSVLKTAIPAIIRQGSVLELPFADNSIDFTFSEGVVEHFIGEKRQRCFSEMARVSRNKVLVFVPNALSEETMKTAEATTFEYLTTEKFETPFTPTELADCLERAGLHNIKVAPVFGEDVTKSKMIMGCGEK